MTLGAGGALTYVITVLAHSQPSPHQTWPLWPYYLCAGMFVIGALLYGGAHEMLPWQKYRALKRRAETAESALGETRRERDEARRELETTRRELETTRRELTEARAASDGQVDPRRLAEDCDRLSRQINEYRAERTRGQPGHRFPTAKTQDGQHRQWVNRQEEQDRYRNETVAGFQQKFATDISRVWHAAKEAGLVGDEDFPMNRTFFEFGVISEPAMRGVADVLAELARRAMVRL